MPLSIFGFQAMWSPYLIGVIVFLTVVYFLLTVKWRKDFKVSEPLKKSEAIYFILAMITFYIIKGSPLDLLSHIMFTVHMIQMAILLLVLPIFLIKGIPWWIWKIVVEAPVVKQIFKIFTFPVISILGFGLVFSVYHIPFVLDTVKLDETFHGMISVILFLSAFFMNWPLINNVPGQQKMKSLYKIGYIIANAIVVTPACALIIFAGAPLYATYNEGEAWLKAMELCVPVSTLSGLTLSGPELFVDISSLRDQQLGGVLMKIVQEIVFGILLVIVFRRWWNEEHKVTAESITEKSLQEFQAKKLQHEQYSK